MPYMHIIFHIYILPFAIWGFGANSILNWIFLHLEFNLKLWPLGGVSFQFTMSTYFSTETLVQQKKLGRKGSFRCKVECGET